MDGIWSTYNKYKCNTVVLLHLHKILILLIMGLIICKVHSKEQQKIMRSTHNSQFLISNHAPLF